MTVDEGRFPSSGIISLLGNRPRHDLSGSTSRNFSIADLLEPDELEDVLSLQLNYGAPQGHEGLRTTIANSLGVDARHILTTPGSTPALFMIAFELFKEPGTAVPVVPAYPATIASLQAVGAKLAPVRSKFEAGYQPTLSAFDDAIDKRTRLVCVATPQSPSGVSLARDLLDHVHENIRVAAPEAFFLVDEAYRLVTLEETADNRSYAGESQRVITTGTLSKDVGLPGLRVGWICTTDDELMQRLIQARLNILDCTSVIDEEIGYRVLAKGAAIRSGQLEDLRHKRSLVEAWVAANTDLIEWVRPDAGGLCCVRLKPTAFPDGGGVFREAISQYGIALGDGEWFGEPDNVFRLGYGALPEDALRDALAALDQATASIPRAH